MTVFPNDRRAAAEGSMRGPDHAECAFCVRFHRVHAEHPLIAQTHIRLTEAFACVLVTWNCASNVFFYGHKAIEMNEPRGIRIRQ